MHFVTISGIIIEMEREPILRERITLAETPKDSFEESLFADGVYIYNPEEEIALAEYGATSILQWRERAGENGNYEIGVVRQIINNNRSGLVWKEHFSGLVPKDWHIWHGPKIAFEAAAELDVQLSPTLVFAGMLHEHHLVVKGTSKSQLLNEMQLAICFARSDLSDWDREEIIAAQRAKVLLKSNYSSKEVG